MARATGFLGGPTRVPPLHNAGAPMHPLAGSRVQHLCPCLGLAMGRLGNRGVGVRNRGVGMKTQACSGLGVWGRGGGRRRGGGQGFSEQWHPAVEAGAPGQPPHPKGCAVGGEGTGGFRNAQDSIETNQVEMNVKPGALSVSLPWLEGWRVPHTGLGMDSGQKFRGL